MQNVTDNDRWICQNPECRTRYTEYMNGCPRCYHEYGLFFRVEYETTKEERDAGIIRDPVNGWALRND